MEKYFALYIEFHGEKVIMAIIKERYTYITTNYFIKKMPIGVSWDYVPIECVDASYIFTNSNMAKIGENLQEKIKYGI